MTWTVKVIHTNDERQEFCSMIYALQAKQSKPEAAEKHSRLCTVIVVFSLQGLYDDEELEEGVKVWLGWGWVG